MVTLTLVSRSDHPPAGLSQPMELPVRYGDSLDQVLNLLNQYRSPQEQIKQVYNQSGQLIPSKLKLTDSLTVYVEST